MLLSCSRQGQRACSVRHSVSMLGLQGYAERVGQLESCNVRGLFRTQFYEDWLAEIKASFPGDAKAQALTVGDLKQKRKNMAREYRTVRASLDPSGARLLRPAWHWRPCCELLLRDHHSSV